MINVRYSQIDLAGVAFANYATRAKTSKCIAAGERALTTGLLSLLVAMSVLAASVVVSPVFAQGAGLFDKLRYKSVRVVPETELTDWTPRQIAVGINASVESDLQNHDADFVAQFQQHLQEGLRQQGFTIDDEATTRLKITIDTLDKINQEKRIVGGLLGRGAVFGTVKVLESGEFRGSYQFSSRVRNLSSATTFDQLAQKVAPRLADKLVRGLRDNNLHSYRNKSLKSS